MSNDEAVEHLTNAMLAKDSAALARVVEQIEAAGLEVRTLYDDARMNAARAGTVAPSFRRLIWDAREASGTYLSPSKIPPKDAL